MTLYENSGLTLKQAWILLLRFFGYSLATAFVFAFPLLLSKSLISNEPIQTLVSSFWSLVMYVVSFLWVIKVGLKWINRDLVTDLKEELTRADYVVLLLVFFLTPLIGIQIELLTANLLPEPPDFLIELFKDLLQPNFLSFLSIAVAPAILEEIFCRGIILEGLLKRYSPTKAIIWSAVLFGAMHLNPWQFVTGLILGLFIGWLYYRTKSIYPGILIHFVNNGLAYLTWLIWGDAVNSTEELVPTSTYHLLVAVSFVLIIAGIWYLNKRMPKRPMVAVGEHLDEKVYL